MDAKEGWLRHGLKNARSISRSIRWVRFSLRGLMAMITVLCLWLAQLVSHAREQREVVRWLRNRGAEVLYEVNEEGSRATDAPSCPMHRLARRLDDDLLHTATYVSLSAEVDDAVVATAARLTGLRTLIVPSARHLTDRGVERLRGLRALESVSIVGSHVTDGAIPTLAGLSRLKTLQLDGSLVSAPGLLVLRHNVALESLSLRGCMLGGARDGLSFIGNLRSLWDLDVANTSLGSNCLEQLTALSELRWLDLSYNPRVGEHGLHALKNLSKLERLNLSCTGVTSESLRDLAHLNNLRVLHLADNKDITDEAWVFIARIPSLKVLDLRNTNVTCHGIERLQTLSALRSVDLSENMRITPKALRSLAKVPGLACLDLHNTYCTAFGASAEAVNALSRFQRLKWLFLSGTGTETRVIQEALPNCVVSGSQWRTPPALAEPSKVDDYDQLILEAHMWTSRNPGGGHVRSSTIAREVPCEVVQRALALTACFPVNVSVGAQQRCLQTIAKRLHRSHDGRRARVEASAELNRSAETDPWMRRLCAAAVDFTLADYLADHVEHLSRIRAEWALTDTESDEYTEASHYLRECFADASDQLGFPASARSDSSSDAIVALWRDTRKPERKKVLGTVFSAMHAGLRGGTSRAGE